MMGAYYLFLAGLFVGCYYGIFSYIDNVQRFEESSQPMDILSASPEFKFAFPALQNYDQSNTRDYTSQFESFVNSESVSNFPNNCNPTLQAKSPNCLIKTNDASVAACKAASSNPTSTVVGYWLNMPKILNFNPAGVADPNFIAIECRQIGKNGNAVELNVLPTNGINRNQLPFRLNVRQTYVSPFVCFVANPSVGGTIRCKLSAFVDDVKSSNGTRLAEAVLSGTIQ